MCNQRKGSVSNPDSKATNTKNDLQPKGGKKNVPQSKKGDTRRGGKGRNKKKSEGCSEDRSTPQPAVDPKPRNTRNNRPGSRGARQSQSSGSGTEAKDSAKRNGSNIPSSNNNGRRRGGNSATAPSGQRGNARHNSVCDRVWKACEVNSHISQRSCVGRYEMDQEYVCVQVWSALFTDLCPAAQPLYAQYIARFGLAGTITRFQEIAAAVINRCARVRVQDADMYRLMRGLPVQTALQLLRFGKRYTPLEWSAEQEAKSLTGFHERNNRARMRDRVELPVWLVKRLGSIGTKIMNCYFGKEFDPRDLLSSRSYETDIVHLPHGTTAEGLRNPFEKWLYVNAAWGRLSSWECDGIDTRTVHDLVGATSKLVMVPKDYRGPRIIMEEPLEVVLEQSMIADALLCAFHKKTATRFCPYGRIRLEDQTYNQELARLGALTKYHSTADLSNASDCITYQLIQAIFPPKWANCICSLSTKKVLLPNGKVYDLHMPCTMGSRLTVPVQSLIYWVIICAAVDILVDLNVVSYDVLLDCSVYNDDLIVPWMIFDTVCDLLELCGLVVNHDKSYTDDHPFRESCGKDYFDDVDVTSIYWPRREFYMVKDELPSLSALHNRLYSIDAKHAAHVVLEYLNRLSPKLPRIEPGSLDSGVFSNTTFNWDQARPYSCNRVDLHMELFFTVERKATGFKTITVCRKAKRDMTKTYYALPPYRMLGELFHFAFERYDELVILDNDGTEERFHRDQWIAGKLRRTDQRPIVKGFRSVTVPGAYLVPRFTYSQTYNNRELQSSIVRKDRISKIMLDDLFERFEYEHWLLNGPRYYDDLCEYLGITQPSRMRKRLQPSGYKVTAVTELIVDYEFYEVYIPKLQELHRRQTLGKLLY